MNHVSVSPTDGNGPTQGSGSGPKVVGSVSTLVRVFLCPCVGPFPSVGLTLTWFIWDGDLALHVTLHSIQLTLFITPVVTYGMSVWGGTYPQQGRI